MILKRSTNWINKTILDSLSAKADELRKGEAEIRQSLKELEKKLNEICQGLSIFCASKNQTLEVYGPDESYYGMLTYNGDTLGVSYRSTEDDIMPYPWYGSEYGPEYSTASLDDCSAQWLSTLVASGAHQELLPQIGEQIDSQTSAHKQAVDQIDKVVSSPHEAVASSLSAAAVALGFDDVQKGWKVALSKVHSDPSSAVTGASSLIETVCKHILKKMDQELPQKQTIQSLFKAAAKVVGLDVDSQVNDDLKQIAAGLASVAQGIGSLRTHFGDAHGRGPNEPTLSVSQAHLSVISAGLISTYLMERLLELGRS